MVSFSEGAKVTDKYRIQEMMLNIQLLDEHASTTGFAVCGTSKFKKRKIVLNEGDETIKFGY